MTRYEVAHLLSRFPGHPRPLQRVRDVVRAVGRATGGVRPCHDGLHRRHFIQDVKGHYRGIRLGSLPAIRTKHLETLSHTLLSTFHALTCHDYRMTCPICTHLRDGHICTLCLDQGKEWSCIRHNCQRSSLQSIAYALRNLVACRFQLYRDVDFLRPLRFLPACGSWNTSASRPNGWNPFIGGEERTK